MATNFIESGTDATQDLTFFQATVTSNGTIATDNTQSQDGPRSIKCNVTVSGGNAYAYTPNGVMADAGRAISCWVRFSTVTPATNTMFMGPETASDALTIMAVGITTGGKLRICGRGTTAKDGATALSANTWYRVTLAYIITSAANWSATVYLNGVSEITTSNTDGTLGATVTSCCLFGLNAASAVDTFGTPAVMSIWIDSIYIDDRTDKTDPGNIHVTNKRAFSNGTTNGYTTQIGAGGSGYGSGHAPQVNEQPLSVTNGWSMVGAGSAVTEEYNIEGASIGDVDISAATLKDYMGWIYTKAALSETGQIIVNNINSNVSLVNANTMFTKAAASTTYPAGTGTDIGEITSTTVTTVSLYECGIVFAYIPAAAAASANNSTLKYLMLMGLGT